MYCVIVRGTVSIEKKIDRFKGKKDMPPVVVKTCYDGDHVGELAWFTSASRQERKAVLTNNKEQFRLIRRPAFDIFEPKKKEIVVD